MTLIKNITKNNKGKNISFEERVSIQHWKKEGLSNRKTARHSNRGPQTIHNEIKCGITIQCKQ
ncbi:helix-turn-helix domain-containing protein [Vagococcus silagei]|uniref:Helix-turn-helix domain-containing protein n=1 Tax=Vagococcus silagei TaxID=2508885 RepID=A0A4S3B6R1_9ENTE|nr:helix-turn-helix domain-containing protein [Vagococcus silagei]